MQAGERAGWASAFKRCAITRRDNDGKLSPRDRETYPFYVLSFPVFP